MLRDFSVDVHTAIHEYYICIPDSFTKKLYKYDIINDDHIKLIKSIKA